MTESDRRKKPSVESLTAQPGEAPGASLGSDGLREGFTTGREVSAVAAATTEVLRSRLGLRRADTQTICQAWHARILSSPAVLELLDDELLSGEAIEACLTALVENWPVGVGEQRWFLAPLSRWRRLQADPRAVSEVAIRLDAALNRLSAPDRERLVTGLIRDFYGLSFEGTSLGGSSRLARSSKRFRGPSPSAASTNWW